MNVGEQCRGLIKWECGGEDLNITDNPVIKNQQLRVVMSANKIVWSLGDGKSKVVQGEKRSPPPLISGH